MDHKTNATGITTANLHLFPISDGDAKFLLELLNDPGWIANIGDNHVRTIEGALDYLNKKLQPGLWLIAKNSDGCPIGLGGLVTGRDGLNYPDIGYAVIDREKGKGYATQITLALLHQIKLMMDLPRVAAITAPSNIASKRVLDKCGFTLVDRRYLANSGGFRDYYERTL